MLNNVKHVSNKYKTKYHTSIILQMIYNVKQCQTCVKQIQNKVYHTSIILQMIYNVKQCQTTVKQLQNKVYHTNILCK